MKNIITTILIFISIDLIGWILLWQYEFWTGENAVPRAVGITLTLSCIAAAIVSAAYLAENWKSINK